jgi:hypothetical protein
VLWLAALQLFFIFKVTLSYQAKEQLERIVFGGVAGLCRIVAAGSFFVFYGPCFIFYRFKLFVFG